MNKDTNTRTDKPAVGCTDLLDACKELTRALDFYDRVQASSEDERIAVGRDHYDWVFRAARTVSSASNAVLSVSGERKEPNEQH